MSPEKLTLKAQEVIAEAQQLAQERNHQQLDGEHLLLALMRQRESLITPLLQKLGVSLPSLASKSMESWGVAQRSWADSPFTKRQTCKTY